VWQDDGAESVQSSSFDGGDSVCGAERATESWSGCVTSPTGHGRMYLIHTECSCSVDVVPRSDRVKNGAKGSKRSKITALTLVGLQALEAEVS
jgi:hypothetical protein